MISNGNMQKDIIDTDGTMNNTFLSYIKSKDIVKGKWSNKHSIAEEENMRRM